MVGFHRAVVVAGAGIGVFVLTEEEVAEGEVDVFGVADEVVCCGFVEGFDAV